MNIVGFFARVDKSGECWLWTGATNNCGYGVLRYERGFKLAHRLSFELHVGIIPPGKEIDHRCRVRNCVNPDHLQMVTHAAHMALEAIRRRDLRKAA